MYVAFNIQKYVRFEFQFGTFSVLPKSDPRFNKKQSENAYLRWEDKKNLHFSHVGASPKLFTNFSVS